MEFDYVTGCAMLIPCKVFDAVGLLDESLFLFYEDSDFCRRVRESGYRVVSAGGTPIYHKVAGVQGATNEPLLCAFVHATASGSQALSSRHRRDA